MRINSKWGRGGGRHDYSGLKNAYLDHQLRNVFVDQLMNVVSRCMIHFTCFSELLVVLSLSTDTSLE